MQPRLAAIQDLSCFGKCSLAVAMPIVAAMGAECVPLPTALLSGHFAALPQVDVLDLTDRMALIADQWALGGVTFDAIFSGYLGSAPQVRAVLDFVARFRGPGAVFVADPAMADRGKLYSGFTMDHVRAMKALCAQADVVLPNVTEACLLLDEPYRDTHDEPLLARLTDGLLDLGAKAVVLTGVSLSPDKVGIACADGSARALLDRPKVPGHFNGTGDIFAAVFTTALTQGDPFLTAARRAMDFTSTVIERTAANPHHRPYGVDFEQCLPLLLQPS